MKQKDIQMTIGQYNELKNLKQLLKYTKGIDKTNDGFFLASLHKC